ncbi:hypothetical protein ACFXD5_05275 [Streptomyces sp. NPDC059385]|uniref:hypothetical protein n=1 Tax=Streptomyces sp. NPDC059385 TaxID=3346817 RepID=UPI0036CE7DC0
MSLSRLRRVRTAAMMATPLALAAALSATPVAASVAASIPRADPVRPAASGPSGAKMYGYKTFTGLSVEIPANGSAWASVYCPQGTRPSGGGGNSDAYTSGDNVYLVTSLPSMDQGSWHVQFANTSPTTGSYGWAEARCTNAESYAHEARFQLVGGGQEKQMTSWCAPGERLSGVGFRSYDPFLRIADAYPQDGVTVGVRSVNSTDALTRMSAVAVCGRDNHTVRSGFTTLQPHEANQAGANCPSGWTPTGGGVVAGGSSTHLQSSEPTAYGWQVSAKNTSSSEATLGAYVICAVPS